MQRARIAYRRGRSLRSALIAVCSAVLIAGLLTTVTVSAPGWPRVRESFLSYRVARQGLPDLLTGFWLNIKVFTVSSVFILLLGLVLATMRTTRGPVLWPLRALAVAYIDVFRGIPLLLVLYLVGFGLPGLRLQGIPSDTVVLGIIALTLSYSAYVAEVFRAGIESVHPSQRAAARSLGLSARQTLRLVVLPQAVRNVVPALLNDLVSLTKDSGLISVLGIPLDVIRYAQIAQMGKANFTPYVVAGLLFMLLTIPMTRITDAVSRRYGYVTRGGHV
ncbi:MAG TPA: amino acid ABC transporter permease [Kineosporiaceae bacterium]